MPVASVSRLVRRWCLRRTVIRCAVGSALALLLLSIFFLNRVGARLDEALLGVGAHALAYPGAPPEETRLLELNGVSLSLRTQEVDAPIRHVIEHYRQRCVGSNRGGSPIVKAVQALSTGSALHEGVGYVACIDLNAADLESLARTLDRFARTWDLSTLGGARYVYARRSVERPATSTFLLSMWVDGRFDLRKLLPLAGLDAEGVDLADFPRPPNAQRLISVREASKPSTMVAYLVHGLAPSQALDGYRARLARRGWSLLEGAPGQTVLIDGSRLLAARKPGRWVSLVAHPADAGGAIVTLLETRSR